MDELVLAHGSRLALDDGKLVELVDRRGHRHARLAWRDGALSSAMVWGAPGAAPLAVAPAIVADPVLGACHALSCGARMAAIDWARPRRIPAIDRPDRIPAGAGTMLLDVIALCAASAEIEALGYDGPYPTHALWSSLVQCFRARAGVDAGVDAFVAGEPVSFAPAPFERVWLDERVWIQLRGWLERASIDGRDYARDDAAARRLVANPDDGGARAELWIGDAPYAAIARFDARGELVARGAPPALTSGVIGREFPPPLVAVLAELIGDSAPAPLTASVRSIVASARLAWGISASISRASIITIASARRS